MELEIIGWEKDSKSEIKTKIKLFNVNPLLAYSKCIDIVFKMDTFTFFSTFSSNVYNITLKVEKRTKFSSFHSAEKYFKFILKEFYKPK